MKTVIWQLQLIGDISMVSLEFDNGRDGLFTFSYQTSTKFNMEP